MRPTRQRVEITGLVERPKKLSLDDLKALPRQDQFMTLEFSGNGSSAGFRNGVYNSRWTGAALAPILKECGIKPGAIEVVFTPEQPRLDECLRRDRLIKGESRDSLLRRPNS